MAAPRNPPHPILLLKTPSPSPSTDAYTLALSPPSSTIAFQPHYIPVLTHTLLPDPFIQLLLTHLSPISPASSHPFPYGALILTSQRAVAALRTALSAPPIQNLPREKLQELKLRLYTVGPATANATEDVAARWLPQCKVYGGAKAGSGEVLVRLMLGDGSNGEEKYDDDVDDDDDGDVGIHANETDEQRDKTPEQQRKRRRPVLFLVGDKRRDIIPKMLRDPPASIDETPPDPSFLKAQEPNRKPKLRPKPIPIDEMLVYQSAELDEFAHTFAQTLRRTEPGKENKNDNENATTRWIVVFSPMAGKGMLEGLGWLDSFSSSKALQKRSSSSSSNRRKTKIACIGPTTQLYLRQEYALEADVVAERPSPEGLRDGIVGYMRAYAREQERELEGEGKEDGEAEESKN